MKQLVNYLVMNYSSMDFLYSKLKLMKKRIKYRKIFSDSKETMGKLSYKDGMFVGDLEHYIKVGESAMNNIEQALNLAGTSIENLKSILDMPCGYGRVTRHLVNKTEPSKITCCEIDKDAVDFCCKNFGCKPLYSKLNFDEIEFKEKFDLIWVGSLFTHIRENDFKQLLKVLYNNLNQNGVLIFTTHGINCVERISGYGINVDDKKYVNDILSEKKFFFALYNNSDNYGISISLTQFVLDAVDQASNGNLKLLIFSEMGWDNHQDVYSFIKS